MITSTLSQLHWYKIISLHFEKAIDYALTTDFARLEAGRYGIDGENAFAIVNEYTTKPEAECAWESHLKYADIQIMISGVEKFGYTPLTDQLPNNTYNPEEDVLLYSFTKDGFSKITLHPDRFIIFFPSDIHQPELFSQSPAPVKKVVIKVKV
jgi:YhcH/YjgK/YiaL family protein